MITGQDKEPAQERAVVGLPASSRLWYPAIGPRVKGRAVLSTDSEELLYRLRKCEPLPCEGDNRPGACIDIVGNERREQSRGPHRPAI